MYPANSERSCLLPGQMRYAANALRYVMFCQLSSGAFAVRQKSLLALLLVARIIPVGLPHSPRVGTVQAKSRRSPVGPAALLFYVRGRATGNCCRVGAGTSK